MLGMLLDWSYMQLQTLIFRSVAEPDTTLALLLREVDYDMLKKYLNSVSRSWSLPGIGRGRCLLMTHFTLQTCANRIMILWSESL